MTNQERKLVEREVIYCVSELISELAGQDDYQDNLLELMQKEDYTEPVAWYIDSDLTIEESMNWLLDYNTNMPGTGNAKNQLRAFLAENEDAMTEFISDHSIDPDIIAALEHYIVSDWFAKKLKGKGGIVGEFMGMTIWGATSSSSILLDEVIKEIASDMEI